MEREPNNLGRTLIDLHMMFTSKIEGFTSETMKKNVSIDAEFKILHLLENYGRLTPSELVGRLCVAKSNLSNQCKMMLKEGLIKQYNDTNDRRIVCYGICTKGSKKYYELLSVVVDNFNELLNQLNKPELAELILQIGGKIN